MPRPRARPRPPEAPRRYPLGDLARAMTHPRAVAVGEVTRWPDAWAGRPDMLKRLAPAPGPRRPGGGHTARAQGARVAGPPGAGGPSGPPPPTPGPGRRAGRAGP